VGFEPRVLGPERKIMGLRAMLMVVTHFEMKGALKEILCRHGLAHSQPGNGLLNPFPGGH
jgi:hypothetical protein